MGKIILKNKDSGSKDFFRDSQVYQDPSGPYTDNNGNSYRVSGSHCLPPGSEDDEETPIRVTPPSASSSQSQGQGGSQPKWVDAFFGTCLIGGLVVGGALILWILLDPFFKQRGAGVSDLPRTEEGTKAWVVSQAESVRDWFSSERSSRKSQDYASLRSAAEAGDADSQFQLGLGYAQGMGVQVSQSQASLWLRKAADQGHADALSVLSCCEGEGLGVPSNWDRTRSDLRKSADRGSAYGQFHLGICYLYGLGCLPDEQKAYSWFRKAAEQNFQPAVEKLK